MAGRVLAVVLTTGTAFAETVTVSPEDVPDVVVREHRTVLPRVARAAEDYARNCQGCHGAEGVSVAEVPRLQGRAGWFTRTQEGRAYVVQVPNVLQAALSDSRLAAMLNWMLAQFSSAELPADFEPYTGAEVARLRVSRIDSVIERRRQVVDGLVQAGVIAAPEALAFSLDPGRY